MAQSPLHQVTHDCTADRLAHDETRTRRGSTLPRCVRVRFTAGKTAAIVHDEERASGPAPPAYRGCKVLAPPQPFFGRQHVMDLGSRLLRPTDGRDPCYGGTRESRGRRGYAYAAGSRGSSRGGGCSAGRCACSLGGSRNESGGGGTSPGCHRAPTSSSQYARVHRFMITGPRVRDPCPSEAGGSSHRQLDLVTVRAITPSGQTGRARRSGRATRRRDAHPSSPGAGERGATSHGTFVHTLWTTT